ncbi:hypothetical protein B0H17DRAFT_1285362 [Mycena rosella]|uniref:Uncharacterized protein n=1 Tax=Mycena rosella TaxID=1033263 RepID=A0AAD7BR31_MYCRO|nr:hypothetical protein B0H17DRAFT_1285362 [Mycena rosella]
MPAPQPLFTDIACSVAVTRQLRFSRQSLSDFEIPRPHRRHQITAGPLCPYWVNAVLIALIPLALYWLLTTTWSRHSGLTEVEKDAAILAITQEDPLARWGGRKIKEKLSLRSVHIPQYLARG